VVAWPAGAWCLGGSAKRHKTPQKSWMILDKFMIGNIPLKIYPKILL
jgi:hypothetical protein